MTTIDKALQGRIKTQPQGLRAVWLAVQTWATRRRHRHALARLDGHMLRDIGMTHSHAAQECAKPFWAE